MPASARPVCLVASASNFWIEKSEISYISEQTSHHPPISCFYLENQKQGYCVNGYVWTKSQFTGNSVLCGMVGECEVELPRLKEVVCFPFPVMMRSSTRPVFPTSPVPVSSLASWLFNWSMKSLSPASKLVTRLTSPSSLKYDFFRSVDELAFDSWWVQRGEGRCQEGQWGLIQHWGPLGYWLHDHQWEDQGMTFESSSIP